MDVTKILAELRQEREQIEEAIISLERLARGRGRRRGRPPAREQKQVYWHGQTGHGLIEASCKEGEAGL